VLLSAVVLLAACGGGEPAPLSAVASVSATAAPASTVGLAASKPGSRPAPVLSDQPWQTAQVDGLAIEMFFDRLAAAGEAPAEGASSPRPFTEGEDVQVRFRLRYAGTDEPYTGAYPAAWLALSKAAASGPEKAAATSAEQCRQRVEMFVGGGLFSRAEVDLNVYYVVTLNDDGTVSVVDPLFGFGGSKLLTLIELGGRGEDWVKTADGDRIFITVPERGEVVVVETRSWEVAAHVAVGGRPTRIALHPNGETVWVGLDAGGSDGGGVAVLDTRTLRPRGPHPRGFVATGGGPHALAFSAGGEVAFVTNAADGTVAVVDAVDLTVRRRITTGREPTAIAYSDLAGAAYVAHRRDGRIAVLRPDAAEPVAWITAEPGLGPIRFPPGGRYGFALNPERDLAHVIDGASNRIVQTGDLPGGPDQVTFSRELGYIRHRDHEQVLMVPLSTIGRPGEPLPVVDFPGGQRPFSDGSGPALADTIVQTPGATAVLVAHPADKMIYFYKEGMAAPMGSFRNYGREPRAVLVIDRSLRETQPGEYATTVRLREAGQYDLAFFVQSPLVTYCFPVQVAANADTPRRRVLRVHAGAAPGAVVAGQEARWSFTVMDESSGEPVRDLSDVRVLVMRTPGTWHTRLDAAADGEGYRVTLRPPTAGTYVVAVASASAGLAMHQGGAWSFTVGEEGQGQRTARREETP
jgi:YVTN family beta-propeller protein